MTSIKTSTRFDHVETVHDCMAGGSLVGESVFIKNLALCPHGRHGLVVYKLKDKVPEELSGLVDLIENARCEDYLVAAVDLGIVASMHSIFPKQNLTVDFDEIEIGSQSWQPKVDVLTERFDALDLINSLDSERVQAFVEQLSVGGDAFQLIDAKVLVETTRAEVAEQANAGAIVAEIAAREADVDAEAAAALGARATIQAEVDQNEADIAQEIVDRVADVNTEEARAVAAEGVIAADIAQEIVDRVAAVSGEASARGIAIDAAVANLIDSSPGALDTLNELAAALGDDASFSASVTLSLAGKQPNLTHGVADGNTLKVDGAGASAGKFARFTTIGLEPQTAAQVKSDLVLVKADVALGSVEDTALSTWAGSTAVASVGTVGTGVWQGTAIADAYIASDVINGHKFSTAYRDRVLANEAIWGNRTAAQIARVDATGPIQAQLDARAPKVDPVFTGSAASFQGGLAWSSGKQMQGVDIVGNNHLLLRTIGGANLRLEPQGAGVVSCSSDISVQNAKKVSFAEATGNGSNTISLKAPDAVTSDVVFELPAADGTAGQVLKTDGNGALSFVTAGGLSAAGNEVITGNWTFEEAVVFEEPIMRTPMELLDTVWAYNLIDNNANAANILTADHSAYLYGSASSTNTNCFLRLSSAAPVGTRIALFTLASDSGSQNKCYVGTQNSEHTIHSKNSGDDRNGFVSQANGANPSTNTTDKWVAVANNDKKYFTKLTTTIWTV